MPGAGRADDGHQLALVDGQLDVAQDVAGAGVAAAHAAELRRRSQVGLHDARALVDAVAGDLHVAVGERADLDAAPAAAWPSTTSSA